MTRTQNDLAGLTPLALAEHGKNKNIKPQLITWAFSSKSPNHEFLQAVMKSV